MHIQNKQKKRKNGDSFFFFLFIFQFFNFFNFLIFLWSRPISGWQQQPKGATCSQRDSIDRAVERRHGPQGVWIEPPASQAPENFVDHAFFLSDHALLCTGNRA